MTKMAAMPIYLSIFLYVLTPEGDIRRVPGNQVLGVSCFVVVVFLAHLSQRLIGELIGYPWSGVRPSVRPSSVHNAQRSSSRKPLGQSKPNFMWSLLG